ncbi:MAG: hypothetical protein QOI44_1709 [Actinomycetota bacterium]|jgi:hypothetical protein|nr:hypothetical protein [Actinomycetota bacterium]
MSLPRSYRLLASHFSLCVSAHLRADLEPSLDGWVELLILSVYA